MNKMTTAISEIKSKVSKQEWQQRILDCQSSSMNVKAWCRENGISTGSYYFYLRKIRESVLEENRIVSLDPPKPVSSSGIRIESGNITITLPENAVPEQLTAVLSALKSCRKSSHPLRRYIRHRIYRSAPRYRWSCGNRTGDAIL